MTRYGRTLLALALAVATTAAAAQGYPEKPVRIIAPFAAGGTVDFTARVIGQALGESLGKTFVTENRTGATGTIANQAVARSAPDGYTLMLADTTLAMVPSLFKSLPFDPVKDFQPISQVIGTPLVLVVHPAVKATTLREFVALVRSQPGKLNYGSGGVGSSTHLGAELFKSASRTFIVHVPYRGAGDAMQAVLGGQVEMLVTALPTALPHIRSGKVRALAVTTPARAAALPEVPTTAEQGLPAYTATNWFGLVAPAGTPRPIVDKLHGEVVRALARTDVRARFVDQGADPVGSTPDEFARFIQAEIPRWGAVIKAAGVQPE